MADREDPRRDLLSSRPPNDASRRRSRETRAEHGEPQEFHYPTSFDRPHRGRDREDVFSQPYHRWEAPRYVFYEGQGYHREFYDAFGREFDPEGGPRGGMGFQVVRGSRRVGPFTGRGPKGYVRSDERILEDVSERLREHGEIDASNVTVRVEEREVALEGAVEDRRTKRLAEDVAASVRGVRDVQNRLRVVPRGTEIDVDLHGPESRSGTGFLTENRETSRPRPR
jgi:BON domain-containing protein